jgi:hypothetical protein
MVKAKDPGMASNVYLVQMLQVWGTTLYLTTLLLVLGKAALISEYVLSLILTKASPPLPADPSMREDEPLVEDGGREDVDDLRTQHKLARADCRRYDSSRLVSSGSGSRTPCSIPS